MRLFLDTANIDEIRALARMGVVDGVTTNPSLLAKEGVEYRERVLEIAAAVDGPISAECISTEVDALAAEARRVAAWHPAVVVKVPMNEAGVTVMSRLAPEGIRFNCTLVFSVNQALLAARAGATFVSPFIGRLDDAGHDGMQLIRDLVRVFDTYHLPTQVLAASVRHPLHVQQAALAGAHVATMPPAVLRQMSRHPLTDDGIARFLADAQTYSPV